MGAIDLMVKKKLANRAAKYKRVVLGLIFLKHISDAFAELHARLLADAQETPVNWFRTSDMTSGRSRRGGLLLVDEGFISAVSTYQKG